VLAGANGAGKSSVAGAMYQAMGGAYFNPDEIARQFRTANPEVTLAEANSAAWRQGKRLLEHAIAERLTLAIETTLGGQSLTDLLDSACSVGLEVRIWFVGLSSPELHLARVRARVAKGGHDIPEAAIRKRYDSSRLHLIRLLPRLTELRVYDNSEEGDPDAGVRPQPKLLLHVARGKIFSSCDLAAAPEWAKPILAVAFGQGSGGKRIGRG
jgi:predicted ABC-type ATPase